MKKRSKIDLIEREQISILRAKGYGVREIARSLDRSPGTISEELKRNGLRVCEYRAVSAHWNAENRKREKYHKCYPLKNRMIYEYTLDKLRYGWSPEQIAGRLKEEHPDDKFWHIHFETIYRFIYAKENKAERLWEFLPRKQGKRRKKGGRGIRRLKIRQRVSIHARSKEINERKEFGHWEGDTVEGLGHRNGIHTEVERVSRFLEARKVSAITSAEGIAAQVSIFSSQPLVARKSTTLDNGRENHLHMILHNYGMKTYFADPYSSWQRGTNENHNGLLRRYLPKGTDLSKVSEEELQDIVAEINNRPKKILGFRTSAEVYNSYIGCSD